VQGEVPPFFLFLTRHSNPRHTGRGYNPWRESLREDSSGLLDGGKPFPQPVPNRLCYQLSLSREAIPGAGLETRRPLIAEFSHTHVPYGGPKQYHETDGLLSEANLPQGEDSLKREQLPLWLAGAAAATTVVSIAAFEILMGAALVAALWTKSTREAWRWPPVTLPVCLWFGFTFASAAVTGHMHEAYPQFKKFYVYLMLFLVFALFRTMVQVRILVIAWGVGATLSALLSFFQLVRKVQAARAAHMDFYIAYIDNRITGFMGHWMTFSGQMIVALMLIGALYFFSTDRRGAAWMIVASVIMTAGLIASYTRSMWFGAIGGGAYLIWMWRRWMILAIPLVIAVVLAANPFALRERAVSAFQPHGDVDSNEHRAVTRKIGWEMIKAHPWFGVGPEQVFKVYKNYIPASVKLPLPTGYYGHLHNIYVHFAAERGVPAMLALMWMLGQSLFDFIRGLRGIPGGWRQRSEKVWVLHGCIAALIGVLLSGWYELNLGDSEVLGMVLAVIACGYVALRDSSGAANAEAAPLRG
jgi:O-antigen ligase